MYWTGWDKGLAPKLISESSIGELVSIDDADSVEIYKKDGKTLIINRPLAIGATVYPDCIGLPINTHSLSCNSKSIVITKDTVISERWSKTENLLTNTGQMVEQVLAIGLVSDKFFGQGFEMSVSKIPGDFSASSCRAEKWSGTGTLSISLTQEGGQRSDGNNDGIVEVDVQDSKGNLLYEFKKMRDENGNLILEEKKDEKGNIKKVVRLEKVVKKRQVNYLVDFDKACWLNAEKWKYYYINVKSLDEECNAVNKCQFELRH